jgi:hypothetical protein
MDREYAKKRDERMKATIELSINWLVIIILLLLSTILAIIFLGIFFKSSPFGATAKEVCLLTIGKLFGKAELCEVFI